jgi:hypothetical protein
MISVILILVSIIGGGLYWVDHTAETCWKYEATQSFEHYKTLKTRSSILRETAIHAIDVTDPKTNPVEVIEKDPNGCSLGSNGMTVIKFYFDDVDKLTTMQVFRNYRVDPSIYQMELIEERKF